MAGLTFQEEKALQYFKESVYRVFPDRVSSVRLFGSKARGDDRPNSDIDLLLTLKEKSWKDERIVYSLVTQTFLETGVYVSPKVFDLQVAREKRRRNNVFSRDR